MPLEVPLDEAYFVWLYGQVGEVESKNKAKSYWVLTKLLHEKEFTWSQNIEKDKNRAHDGTDLRREFLRTTELDQTIDNEDEWLCMPCSMFEMLVALSFKLAWDSDGRASDWFWILIDNIGLYECSDAYPPDKAIFDLIIDKVIQRDYAKNGAGGLFPLKKTRQDQRKVELWYQAQAYLLERL